ncbi:MAG: hypothetical protein RMI90_07835 [Thermoguttaceae bacterium]|nr:hypothetical protein [Thermoguttaceae bacterium]
MQDSESIYRFPRFPPDERLSKIWADGGYAGQQDLGRQKLAGQLVEWLKRSFGWVLEIASRLLSPSNYYMFCTDTARPLYIGPKLGQTQMV